MQSLKILKFNMCIFGILFVTYSIQAFSEFITDHTFNWLKSIVLSIYPRPFRLSILL